jgi:hypothetical protein
MLWGQNDQAVTANSSTTKETSVGAPIGTYSLVKGSGRGANPISMAANADFGNTSPGSKASVDYNMYGNTTINGFINNMAVGVFGVNATTLGTTGGNLAIGIVTYGGSGYGANAAVTLTVTNGGTSGVVNAHANGTTLAGKIDSLLVQTAGSGYITAPTVAIAAPAAISIGSNSTYVNTSAGTILLASANSRWQANDHIYYGVASGNTAIPGLVGNSYYYVSFANASAIALSAAQGGANIAITANGTSSETGHTLLGDTATGYVDINSTYPQVTHAGWVVRREGTGGRAGRIQYETLVAMGSLGVNGTSTTGVYGTASVTTSNSTVDQVV